MLTYLSDAAAGDITPLTVLTSAALRTWREGQPDAVKAWIDATGFNAEPDSVLLLPGPDGGVARALCGVEEPLGPWSLAAAPAKLGRGLYRLDPTPDLMLDRHIATQLCLGWALGTYRFSRYKSKDTATYATLVWPEHADRKQVARAVEAIALVRNLVNTPAGDLGPAELAEAAVNLGAEHGAEVRVIVGNDLLDEGYPAIYAVGKGSSRAPRLIDLRWQPPGSGDDLPKVSVVGKGVVFDSGGLDIKPAASMKLMKKDMGGAAHALGLCSMIMDAGLPVRLRMLVPAVENAVSDTAFHPLDVLETRKGITVEVGNTDAEGRLVLCDALADADADEPELIVDFATLTGAARVALGPELAAMFCNDDTLADELLGHSLAEADPMWRLPLHRPYAKWLASKVADTNNVGESRFGDAIVAALFLDKFVRATTPWLHFDVYAWNPSDRPGRPAGGEAFAIRAVYRLLHQRYGRR
ncbi:leucyl aminopeptidase family protein [Haliangium sp.]|uniref:leucyl aminopeptidase family protein n=1 Tax=Haliangium sp. TaxID=2663208 RepID=UPI003D11A9A4